MVEKRTITVGINPILSDFKEPETSKLDWKYLEHDKIDMNDSQICTNSQKGRGIKMNNFEKFDRKKNLISAVFLRNKNIGPKKI